MTLFDKVLISLHKGFEKIKQGSAVFSERVKFELEVIRMRIKIHDLQAAITGLHARIGRRVDGLREQGGSVMPESFEAFLKDDEVAGALGEVARLTRELEEIKAELMREQQDVAAAAAVDKEDAA